MGAMNDAALAMIASLAALLYLGQAWETWRRKYQEKKRKHGND